MSSPRHAAAAAITTLGDSVRALRLGNALWSALLVLPVFALGRRMGGPRVALAAAAQLSAVRVSRGAI